MDILRKELESIYAGQHLGDEMLPRCVLDEIRRMAETTVRVNGACAVVTDAASDRCYVYTGPFGMLMGFADSPEACEEVDSSDEDAVYARIHPEDLVEKRMLEYEFFKTVDRMPPEKKRSLKATCTIRMRDGAGRYRHIDNSTQVIGLSPAGSIWLILCCYAISPGATPAKDIMPRIIDNSTGDVTILSFEGRRGLVLSQREKEVLRLIREGLPSKQIAALLGISVHTVSRHRQNIMAKLSVGNSIEAVTAATSMKLL